MLPQGSMKLKGFAPTSGDLPLPDSIRGMPLVLAMNEASESGISYDDVPYVSYEYPRSYRRRLTEGAAFVYYRGRKKAAGGRHVPAYLGTGIVGSVRPSGNSDRLVCQVLDGTPFSEPVPFKTDDGKYLEPGGSRAGYYVQGVRAISDEAFVDILARAKRDGAELPNPPKAPRSSPSARNSLYAAGETGREVEDYSREVAVEYLLTKYPGCTVCHMPRNNPGYDLATNQMSAQFVEVKGTQAGFARFAMSEGERRFAEENRDAYLLIVVYGVDLDAETHSGIATARAPLGASFQMEPIQWAGRLIGP
jgi:uncharacterized protein DUF3883